MAKLAPIVNNAQFINGIPANGAKLFFYAAGSSTKQTTYTDEAGTIPQTNPVILDSRGESSQPIWFTEGLSYKIVFAPSTDSDPPVSPIWDVDNVTGINDASLTIDQWIDSGVTPTYVSATQFTLPGDQTSQFTVGRRIKVLVTAGTAYGTITASVFGALTTVTVSMDSTPLDSGLSSVQYGLITPTNSSLPYNLSATAIQNQTYTAYTTGGTSTAYTLTPLPALTALTTNHRFNVTFNATAGVAPTLAISGLAAKNLKYYDAAGNKQTAGAVQIVANLNTDVVYDGTDYVVLNPAGVGERSKIQPITAVANTPANSLTITLNPTQLDFRSSTLGSGTVNTRAVPAAISVVVSSGSTLGTVNATLARLAVLAIDNSGTVELAVANTSGTLVFDDSTLISTTAEGGAGGADSASVIYSTTSRASVPFRIVGYINLTQATAGTWVTAPSLIQGAGGEAANAVSIGFSGLYQSAIQTITSAGALTLAHGLGREPILFSAYIVATSAEAGYSIGDKLQVPTGPTTNANRGLSIVPDATNINIRYGSDVSVFEAMNKTTGATAALTNTSWRLVIKAWG